MGAAFGKPPSQRGVRGAIARLRGTLGDSAIVGLYVPSVAGLTLSGSTVVSLDDVRGASGFGPQLASAGSARPTYNTSTGAVAFDGVDDYLRGSAGTLANLTDSMGMAIITTMPTVTASIRRFAEISVTDTTSALLGYVTATTGLVQVIAASGSAFGATDATTLTGRRVVHFRRTRVTDLTVGVRAGAAAETTGTQVGASVATDRFTLGASRNATPSGNADISVAAVVLYNGTYGTTQQNAVNTFAAMLGATV